MAWDQVVYAFVITLSITIATTGNKCGFFAARLLDMIPSLPALLLSHFSVPLCKTENKEHKVLSLRSKRIGDLWVI